MASLNNYAVANSLTPWYLNKTAPNHITALSFTGATMTLGGNMSLNMKLESDLLAVAGLDITKISFVDLNDQIRTQATLDENGYYSVSYDKRAAEMAETMHLYIVFTLANGAEYCSNDVLSYSPAKYLTNLYEDYTGIKGDDVNATYIVNTVTNMLAYGAAAEALQTGKAAAETETAKAAALSEITLPTVFPYVNGEYLSNSMTSEDKANINSIAMTGASLTGTISISFQMTDAAYTNLTVDGKTYTVENGYITLENILPTNIKKTYSLVFSGEGVEDVTANFSVGDFLGSRLQANEADKALVEATICYMMAVREYAIESLL